VWNLPKNLQPPEGDMALALTSMPKAKPYCDLLMVKSPQRARLPTTSSCRASTRQQLARATLRVRAKRTASFEVQVEHAGLKVHFRKLADEMTEVAWLTSLLCSCGDLCFLTSPEAARQVERHHSPGCRADVSEIMESCRASAGCLTRAGTGWKLAWTGALPRALLSQAPIAPTT
jgi:hypothetical protein